MHPATSAEAKALFDATKKIAEKSKQVSIVVAPPSLYVYDLAHAYKGKRIAFAIQSARAEKVGAFTGTISLAQARDAGASYAIIGHAERRAVGETNDDTRTQVATALALKMTPILCVGELVREESGEHFSFIKEQLRMGFADVSATKIATVVIAYEPEWAVGALEAMTPRGMHEMAIFIRKTMVGIYGKQGMKAVILYGGAINETNAEAMLRDGDVDGLLVGRASSDAKEIAMVIEPIHTAYWHILLTYRQMISKASESCYVLV